MKEWMKKNWGIIVSILLNILLLIVGILLITHYKNEAAVSEHNYQTAIGELNVVKTKNGELIAERDSYVATVKDLEKLNISSQAEIKRLEKTLDKDLEYIAALKTEINIRPEVHDTIYVIGDTLKSDWGSHDKWYALNGSTVVVDSTITTTVENLQVNVPLTVGLTDSWSIFVKTDNPYVGFNSIEGAVLDKDLYTKKTSPRRWGLGINAGFGCGYDLIGKTFYAGPGIQVGVYYRLF